MRIYIATGHGRAGENNRLRDILAERGHELTYDWTSCLAFRDQAHRAEMALHEVAGVMAADVVVVLLPGGIGTHFELATALAHALPVILHHDTGEPFDFAPYACPFYLLPGIERVVGGYERVVEAVERLALLAPGRIAGAPCVPVWESDDAKAYRREMGGRRT